jgi:hypothetical protein
MTRATLTPLGWIPGKATGLAEGVKEAAAQASMIVRWMIARSHKAAAAAAAAVQAAKYRQFKAFQEELGLLLDNDGEALAPSTSQKAAA